LADDLECRVITVPYFLATKAEAFKGRAKGDYSASADLEDIITVVDGREKLIEEITGANEELRTYLSDFFRGFSKSQRILEALPGHLPPDEASQARLPGIIEKLKELGRL